MKEIDRNIDGFSPEELDWLNKWNLVLPFNLFNEAMTHKSIITLHPNAKSYERIEFVGDAVIDLITSDLLYCNGEFDEGQMTFRRTYQVNNKKLSKLFNRMDLVPLIRTYSGFKLSDKIKADFVESLFGVMFIHNGYAYCKDFWIKLNEKSDPESINVEQDDNLNINGVPLLVENMERMIIKAVHMYYKELGLVPKDPITVLQEYCQMSGRSLPEYTEINREGPVHDPIFTVQVIAETFKGQIEGLGTSSTKKNAKEAAAAELCDKIYLHYLLQ